jgi:hypothetical protein
MAEVERFGSATSSGIGKIGISIVVIKARLTGKVSGVIIFRILIDLVMFVAQVSRYSISYVVWWENGSRHERQPQQQHAFQACPIYVASKTCG